MARTPDDRKQWMDDNLGWEPNAWPSRCDLCGNALDMSTGNIQVTEHTTLCGDCIKRMADNPIGQGRVCEYCERPLLDGWPSIYCSNQCANRDA